MASCGRMPPTSGWNGGIRVECSGDECPCRHGESVHPPLLLAFVPEAGEYIRVDARCIAQWASGQRGRVAGQICGKQAEHQFADLWLCEYHYQRARQWAKDQPKRDHFADMAHLAIFHEERMRFDREQAKQRAVLRRGEAKLERELEKERILAEETAREAARAENSLVYYVQRTSDGLIKIGTSRKLASRLATLKGEHGPLLLIAATGGMHAEETALHRRFADLRAEGEWFRPELPLLEHVFAVMKEHPVTPTPGLPPVMDHRVIFRMIRKIRNEVAEERRQKYWDEQDRLEAEGGGTAESAA